MSTEFYLPQIPQAGVISKQWVPAIASTTSTGQHDSKAHLSSMDLKVSPWCVGIGKRIFDLACVVSALVLLSPLLALVAIAVRLTSSGPVIFRQQRVGKDRRLFVIYKFRTMVENSESIGPHHTAKGDPRITPLGHFLRHFKLDEFPQLYNVLRGDMSLVGPRPKLPEHEHTKMVCRPGVTGAATLAFRDEQRILCEVPTERLEVFYREHVVPLKISLDSAYMQKASFASDLHMLWKTLLRRGNCLAHHDLLLGPRYPVPLDSPHRLEIVGASHKRPSFS